MRNIKGIITSILSAILLTSALAACGNQNSGIVPAGASSGTATTTPSDTPATTADKSNLKTIHIGFPSSGSAWPGGILGAASEYGYLEEYLNTIGYTAELDSFVGAAPAIHEALVAKQLDYVVYAGMAADLSKANGIDTTLISITGWGSGWELVANANSGINTIQDLRGKKVAYMRGASPQMYLIRILNEAGLTFNDIQAFNTTIPDGLASVTTDSADACIISNGQAMDLINQGVLKVIHQGFTADKSVYYEPSVFIARTDAYNENKEVAVAIEKSFLKARDKAKEEVDAYYRLLAEKSGVSLEQILATAERDLDVSIPLNFDEQYMDAMKSILMLLHDNDLTQGNVDFDAWIDGGHVVNKAAEEYINEK